MATRAAEEAIGVLPDDIHREIFTCVSDPVNVLHCASTSRQWLRFIADDPAFLRRACLLTSFLVEAFC